MSRNEVRRINFPDSQCLPRSIKRYINPVSRRHKKYLAPQFIAGSFNQAEHNNPHQLPIEWPGRVCDLFDFAQGRFVAHAVLCIKKRISLICNSA